ncbi:MAG: SMP-30/gluconolactonase/LRE family protein [Chloroflexota bacterium]|nr:SMP-30/gluconolactonase/LRE family protein [Chloroflexota bacterium]
MSDSQAKPARFARSRALLFLIASLAIGALLIVAMTWFVIGSPPRAQAVAVASGVTVSEFVALPDDDAYPAALAIGVDGTVYTGSYQSGALWAISRESLLSEIPGSRERIGSVTGLDVAPDGRLYILDRITPLDAKGAVVWTYADGELNAVLEIPHSETLGLALPDDIALDSAGEIYISDRKTGRVWRYTAADEALAVFWQLPCGETCAATGLAYDPGNDAMLITDSETDTIYRVAVGGAGENAGRAERIYVDRADSGYGMDGLTVSPNGEIYIALLAWNRVAKLQAGELIMLARDFRGASDVAYDADSDRLFVSNWNQFSLGFGTRPQLPFALDVIGLSPKSD